MVLVSPVPVAELVVYELAAGEKLSVDGNFAFVRTASVSFHAEMSSKSILERLSVANCYCKLSLVLAWFGLHRRKAFMTR